MLKNIFFHYPHLKLSSGGTKFILTVCKQLSKHINSDFIFLTNSLNINLIKQFSNSNVTFKKISFLTSNSILYWLFFPFFFCLETFQTYRTIKKGNIVLSCLFPSNAICAVACKFRKAKHYHYCYEPFPFLQNKKFIETTPIPKKLLLKVLSFLYSGLDSYSVKHAEKVFTLNQITKKMIKKTYGIDAIVTLMGVDTQHFKPTKQNLYKKYAPYVVHSTDYISSKNTDLAIKTISECDKNIKLLITSTRPDATEKNDLIELAKKLHLENRVVFLDLVDYEKLPSLYSNALCYLSCSYDEMMGTTSSNLPVKEALACGTPALRANITTEDVEDNKSGFLIDPRKTQSVAKKINYLFTHPEISKKMGMIGRKRIVKEYRWEQVAKIIQKEMDLL